LQAKRRQAAARERKTRDRADTAAAERDRQKNEEQKKEQHQKNKKKKDDAAEDLKQEVNMKLQNQQLEELGVRTELIALQAEFEQNGASPLGKSGYLPQAPSLSMAEPWLTGGISQELRRLILVSPTHQGRRSGGGEGARGGQAASRPFFARVRNHCTFSGGAAPMQHPVCAHFTC
jgi:hypothetical protein